MVPAPPESTVPFSGTVEVSGSVTVHVTKFDEPLKLGDVPVPA
jgi:hypothetical protein